MNIDANIKDREPGGSLSGGRGLSSGGKAGLLIVVSLFLVLIGLSFAGCSKKDKRDEAGAQRRLELIADDNTPGAGESVRRYESNPHPAIPKRALRNGRLHINYLGGSLSKVFNDSNASQLVFARSLGIEPIRDLESAFHTRRPVREIVTNEHYLVDTLTHSLPFLVPEAADLLDDIGAAFIDSLAARSGYGYRIKVTSLLRTPATVKALRRVNVNATDSSTHQFGTTFDISYTKFQVIDSTLRLPQEDLKNLLAEVLYDFRRRGRCLVKYERKTACFHVTATR